MVVYGSGKVLVYEIQEELRHTLLNAEFQVRTIKEADFPEKYTYKKMHWKTRFFQMYTPEHNFSTSKENDKNGISPGQNFTLVDFSSKPYFLKI